MRKILITGGAGFIGSHFTRFILSSYPETDVTVLDKLTYAGNPENLREATDNPRYHFIKGDICDRRVVSTAMQGADTVVNFAAETHVDRSIMEAESFAMTDVIGTLVLLQEAMKEGVNRYLQISTDEVYGSIEKGSFTEESPLRPNNLYSASKAGGDHVVRSFFITHGFPAIITRCSNNYGPNQFPEKIIPLFITNTIDNKQLPLYGDGGNVRDWIHVADHCAALDLVLQKGEPGEIYNIGGAQEKSNIEITKKILNTLGKPESLIKYVMDRPGHDRRYSVDFSKISRLGFSPKISFEEGIVQTVRWYQDNESWWRPLKDPTFWEYYKKQYKALE